MTSRERVIERCPSGFAGLLVGLLLIFGGLAVVILGARQQSPPLIVAGLAALVLAPLTLAGLFIVNPGEARVLVLFGDYRGSVKRNGFFWTNPFMLKHRVSLRARNLNGDKLKVNDRAGNPIEIAAVVVWQVLDTYAARFEVDDYLNYVETQSESAVRKLASSYHYDGEENESTLRGDTEEVNDHLRRELQERLQAAGIHVVEARISHMAYAPEIAHAMLQRQQATAVVAARQKIVEGAVGMVEMALAELAAKKVVDLDDERRAAMVSNLLVVLCSERTTPVVNTGTLYQ